MKKYFVYMFANRCNGTIYVGSTSNLMYRIWQHKNNTFSSFTSKYFIHQLVYYEEHINLVEMIRRERRLKNWCRQRKLNLIGEFNPSWRDLYSDLLG